MKNEVINDNKLQAVIGRLMEINNCMSHMESLRDSYCIEIMREWSKQLSKDFPRLKKCEFISPDHSSILYTGVAIPYKQLPESIHILIQARNGMLFYGLKNLPKLDDKHDEIQKELSYVAICNDLLKSEKWLYYNFVSYDKGYEKLKELITNMAT